MQTTIRISATEIPSLIAVLQTIFKKEKTVEITVNSAWANSFAKKETKEEYIAKLYKRLENLDEGKNIVSFTGKEFERFVNERMEKYGNQK